MKKNILLLFLFITCLARAQTSISSRYAIDRLGDAGGLSTNETVYGIPQKPGEIIGDYYYYSLFRLGSIILKKDNLVIRNVEFRYHVKNHNLEINYPTGLRVLDGNKIKAFEWSNLEGTGSFFVNSDEFNFHKVNISCFFEIISDGSFPLLKRRTYEYLPANYVPALNAGTRDDKIIKKDDYYFARESVVYELPRNKKKLLEFFKDSKASIAEYIDREKLSLRNQNDLKRIFDFINLDHH